MSAGLVSIFIAGWLIVSITGPALAYLDPVTGSFLIQGLIASAVALLAAMRSVRERVLALFGFRKPQALPTKTNQQADVSAKPAGHDSPQS